MYAEMLHAYLHCRYRRRRAFRLTSIPWFERKFDFVFPLEYLPNILARLRGTPARLEELLGSTASHRAIAKIDKIWSAQEHAGHLEDMEPLWLARVEDFVSEYSALTPADLQNRRTHQANHNSRSAAEILAAFRTARSTLVHRVSGIDSAILNRTLPHPRMQTPMRLIDHLYFVAEHDDHHLARMHDLLASSDSMLRQPAD